MAWEGFARHALYAGGKWRRLWRKRSRAAKAGDDRYYGDGGTIHASSTIDIEVDPYGRVVAAWFRCQQLPFEASQVTWERTREMDRAFENITERLQLTGVIIHDRRNEVRQS